MRKTSKSNFGGGDTRWEEDKLGPYAKRYKIVITILLHFRNECGMFSLCTLTVKVKGANEINVGCSVYTLTIYQGKRDQGNTYGLINLYIWPVVLHL